MLAAYVLNAFLGESHVFRHAGRWTDRHLDCGHVVVSILLVKRKLIDYLT